MCWVNVICFPDDGQFTIYPGVITDSTIGITWGAPFSAVSEYQIRYLPPTPGQNNLFTVPATDIRSLQLTGLYSDTTYTITISARSGPTFITEESITVRTSEYCITQLKDCYLLRRGQPGGGGSTLYFRLTPTDWFSLLGIIIESIILQYIFNISVIKCVH